ncbi:MAG: hypothetical protein MJZ15_07865 [Bacteroidales bacterium]|nr:hypothetical protein [Bacteroidales bacterium]
MEVQFNAHNKEEFPPMHTTEHIVNRAMINLFGCGRAVSAHIERKKSKLDYSLPQAPTDDQVQALVNEVNSVIARHLPVSYDVISQAEAQARFDLKRLPDGASDSVRVVSVGDYDECLCIGLHVQNTSEIGRFAIISHDYDSERHIWRMRFRLE